MNLKIPQPPEESNALDLWSGVITHWQVTHLTLSSSMAIDLQEISAEELKSRVGQLRRFL